MSLYRTTAINTVRSRAGLPPLSGLSQEELRDAIRQERAWELVGEGNHRRLDLVRWGILGQALTDRHAAEIADPEAAPNNIATIKQSADNFQPHFVRGPIPSAEILLNPNLTQNAGY